jgi:hypothetical protein
MGKDTARVKELVMPNLPSNPDSAVSDSSHGHKLFGRAVLDLSCYSVVLTLMNITDLTPQQLRRAASIKEKLDSLNKELRRLLDGAITDGAISSKKRTMSAAVKRKIAATQRARWAKRKRAKA